MFADVFISILVFTFSVWLYHGKFWYEVLWFGPPAFIFYGTHIFISLANRKYEHKVKYSNRELLRLYGRCWLYTSGLALLVIVTFEVERISRLVLLSNIFGLLIGEMLLLSYMWLIRKSVLVRDPVEIEEEGVIDLEALYPSSSNEVPPHLQKQSGKILQYAGNEVRKLLSKHFDLAVNHTLVLNANSRFQLLDLPTGYYHHILNFHRLNNIRYINKFLEAANSRFLSKGS